MSMLTNKKGEIVFNREGRRVKDILSTVRKGMRMSDTHRRFALTAATVLVLALILVIMFAAGKANDAAVANEKYAALADAIGAERIEMGKKTIEMTAEHGTKVVDGKRMILLQKVGQQKTGNAKVYWLTICAEADVPAYEEALGKDKKEIDTVLAEREIYEKEFA